MSRQSIGQLGENQAASVLQKQGYKIIERNYRAGRWGEIDLIALEGVDLVFIEVKTRTSQQYGQPIEAISYYKKRSLRRAAHYFKLTHPKTPDSLRLDVVTVQLDPSFNIFDTMVYKNVDIN